MLHKKITVIASDTYIGSQPSALMWWMGYLKGPRESKKELGLLDYREEALLDLSLDKSKKTF